MPKAALISSVIIFFSVFVSTSYAFYDTDLPSNIYTSVEDNFSTGIFEIPDDAKHHGIVKRYLIFGNGDFQHSGVFSPYTVTSPNGFFSIALLSENQIPQLQTKGHFIIEDFQLDLHDGTQDVSRIGQITGSNIAYDSYNYTGKNVTIAIVDTGVDFSNLDIRDSLARDKNNHPIMLDADGQGIIITNATFYAFVDDAGIIRNSTSLPDDVTSSVYRTPDGVFLDVAQKGQGTTIQIYNSFFPIAGSGPVFNGTLTEDMKIGKSHQDYIVSKSGIYHLGIMYQGALEGALARLQVVPVLVTDPNVSGVYDTITPDLSTSWKDYTRFDLAAGKNVDYDFDFTDEKPIVLGSGNEFLIYDSDDDGRIDYSAGVIGARVLDVYGALQNKTATIDDNVRAINGTLLSPFDQNGNYFGVMTDFQGHGTSSAASIVSKGINQYDIYNNTEKFIIRGVAPDAKIIPVKSLWFGDAVYSWLWAAGFDNDNQAWVFGKAPRAEIISNSWGVSNFPSIQYAPGMDALSLIMSMLSTPHSLDDDFPGVTMVVSSGNSGPGYGTMGTPNSSPFGISVGATTNNVYVGYGPFKDQPRFGNSTEHFNHVVDFSSRGPGIIGDPKPDLMSIGAHSFTPSTMLKLEKNSKTESFSLFGGTSMAAPLVAGSAAVLIESMNANQVEYDPFLIKNILMSSASDLHNDPLTQGSGLVNVENAVKFVEGKDVFLVHNDASYQNIKSVLKKPFENINSTALNLERFELPSKNFEMTSWFAGYLNPGERSSAIFTIENPTDEPIEIEISATSTDLIKKTTYSASTEVRLQDRLLDDSGTYRPNYVELSDVKNFTDLGSYFENKSVIPSDSDLLILNLNFPFNEFMNKTNDIYGEDLRISSLYLYDWIDKNNNTQVTSDELSMITRGGSWGTVQELRVSDPGTKFNGTPLVGVYPVPTKFSFWIGDTRINATSMNYTLTSSYFKQDNWKPLWIDNDNVIVPAKGVAQITTTIVAPTESETGVYQGFLKFNSSKHSVSVPVTYVIKNNIFHESDVLITGESSESTLHGPGYLKGAFDMTNRYMAGDWRQYYFDIQDPEINTAAIEFAWEHDDTNLAVFAIDPSGKIIQTNVPSGVFGHFMGWPSLDWLGTSPFSQGGGFFPIKNKDNTSTVLYIPINQTGMHSLLVHSTLFAGNSTTESISLFAKFINISTNDPKPKIDIPVPDIVNENSIVIPKISDNNLFSVSFFVDDVEIFQKEDKLDFSLISDGEHKLIIIAIDEVGNNSTKQFSFIKETTLNDNFESISVDELSIQTNSFSQNNTQQNNESVSKHDTLSEPDDFTLVIVLILIAVGISVGVFIILGNSTKK